LRALYDWAITQEPAHLDPPPQLIASCLFDGFFQAPILLVILYGLVRQRVWVRKIAPIYAAAAVTNMFFYFSETFLGPHPPPNLAVYLPFNLPWLIAPVLLALRTRSKDYSSDASEIESKKRDRFRVRTFESDDAEQVAELWKACFPNDPPRNEPRLVIARKLAKDRDLFLVVEDNNLEQGSILGTAIGGWDGYRGWVYHVATAHDQRRTGLGRLLMNEIEQRLRERGCPKLNLQVRNTNASVIAFYEALGYQHEDNASLGKSLE
jgi:ribosomal protein S18 acetylase RimI-like enzyme